MPTRARARAQARAGAGAGEGGRAGRMGAGDRTRRAARGAHEFAPFSYPEAVQMMCPRSTVSATRMPGAESEICGGCREKVGRGLQDGSETYRAFLWTPRRQRCLPPILRSPHGLGRPSRSEQRVRRGASMCSVKAGDAGMVPGSARPQWPRRGLGLMPRKSSRPGPPPAEVASRGRPERGARQGPRYSQAGSMGVWLASA